MIERGGALVPAAYAARRIGVTPRTIRRWIAGGVLQGRAVPSYARDRRCRWFVLRAALDAFLARDGCGRAHGDVKSPPAA